MAHGGIAQSLVGLVWVLALFPSCLGPDLSGNGPALPWAYVALGYMVLRFVSLRILSVFSMYSINALLQNVKHQNLWKVLVLKPYFVGLVFVCYDFM